MAWGLTEVTQPRQLIAALNIDSVTSYSWVHHVPFPTFPASGYRDAADRAAEYWAEAKARFGVPYHLDVSIGWDPEPAHLSVGYARAGRISLYFDCDG